MRTTTGPADVTALVISWPERGVLAAGLAGLLICAGMVAAGRRRRSGLAQDGVVGALWGLGGLALAAVAAALAGALAG